MRAQVEDDSSVIYPIVKERLKKQGYQIYGKQIAVKKCLWTHNYLKEDRFCYKNAYGIQSHRCIQASPTLLCNHQCFFCWRLQEKDIGLKPIWKVDDSEFDSPEEVYNGLIWGWKRCISGYKPFTDKKKYDEALKPKHVALSLTGEPTLYPYLSELLNLLEEKGLSTFLVSNGTNPDAIEKMVKTNITPSQLYITIPAPDREEYKRICRPLIKDGWGRIIKSLELMRQLKTRTVVRLTMAKNINMIKPVNYVSLIKKANPSFIEIKGFVPVGFSQYRVTRSNMPLFEDIKEFADQILAIMTDYHQVYEMKDSKVVILSNNKHPLKISFKEK